MFDEISKIIIAQRKKEKKTQEEIAKELGVSRASYISFEKQPKNIPLETMLEICNALGIRFEELWNNRFDEKKFEDLYFYILDQYKSGITKTKLAKLIYLCDFGYYYKTKKSITNATYIHRQYGPVADIFLEETDDFQINGKIMIKYLSSGAQIISSLIYDREYISLSDEEKKFTKEVCLLWKNKNTAEIVNFTHEQAPWRETIDYQRIPYCLIEKEKCDHVYQPVSARYDNMDFSLIT